MNSIRRSLRLSRRSDHWYASIHRNEVTRSFPILGEILLVTGKGEDKTEWLMEVKEA